MTYVKIGDKFLFSSNGQVVFAILPPEGGDSRKAAYFVWRGPVLSDNPVGFKESFEWPISPKFWDRHIVTWDQLPQDIKDHTKR